MARWSWDKSERSDWFFLGREFAIRIRTVSITKTTKRKRVNTLILRKETTWKIDILQSLLYNKGEEDEYSRSEFYYDPEDLETSNVEKLKQPSENVLGL